MGLLDAKLRLSPHEAFAAPYTNSVGNWIPRQWQIVLFLSFREAFHKRP